jgi:hypothetical protein
MKFGACAALLTLALGMGLSAPVKAQQKRTIAIMPTQYFSADAQSAEAITRALAEQFERQGYTVIAADRATSTFQSQGLDLSTHYPDRVALKFGRAIGADLVAYPRLLAMGIPAAATSEASLLEPAAVLHLRVLNNHTGSPIYFRQIGHEFRADAGAATGEFRLPDPVATETAGHATQVYFERVAGSRQEMRSR